MKTQPQGGEGPNHLVSSQEVEATLPRHSQSQTGGQGRPRSSTEKRDLWTESAISPSTHRGSLAELMRGAWSRVREELRRAN